MHKQQQPISSRHVPHVPSRKTATIEQKLGQLQAQLRQMPMPESPDYGFSLMITRRFAQEVIHELGAWLNEMETPLIPTRRRRS